MGMLVVVAVLVVLGLLVAMFVHALRADRSEESHRWLAVVPLLIIVLGLLGTFAVC